ncbi:DUF2167 domain-containing protein [Variovorax sp. J22R24]|uniref:DUF2167 domain-containing protein n=1 Tax=Variovorax gracilis TaxID=3053502 RepID=UPI002576A94F|nr:DUF2167 domain-containing protein [Variovorax sp. J22R24]MDM0109891.1 DUF2167 domain-containing protein [Variovorax sp. J22R24]
MSGFRAAAASIMIAAYASTPFAAAPTSREEAIAQMRELQWIRGPITGQLGTKATIEIPKEGSLLDGINGSKFLEITGNLPSPGTNIVMYDGWWAALDFTGEGYVKDNDKVDPDALLKILRDSDGPANEQRRKLGLREMYTEGWYVPPHYDDKTKYLEWGLTLRSAGSNEPTINYTVRILGRTGHESATLVSSPERLDDDVKSFKRVLSAFSFVAGEKYSEFRPGDKVAAYGLGALVVGGAAAVATKTGFWKVLAGVLAAGWKFVAAGAVALLAGLGKLLGGKSNKA